MEDAFEKTCHRLRACRRLVVLTGAGISAESGVPTFRGDGGLWRQHRPEDLATPDAFRRDPLLVWEWYDWRRTLIAGCEPNPGHAVLARWERRFEDFTLVTQNVDGLHRRAGSTRILELHGDLWELRCTACSRSARNLEVPLRPLPPCCPCGALLRPGVVWFGESLPENAWMAAVNAVRQAEVVVVAGTSGIVQPAASLPLVAHASGAWVIEVNLTPTPLSFQADARLEGPSGEVLPRIEKELETS